MRRKAFWGDSGAMMRQVPSLVNGEMVNFGINAYGVQFERRDNGQLSRLIPWAELHRLAQQNPQGPLEQLGAAVAERSEPRILPADEIYHSSFVPGNTNRGLDKIPRTCEKCGAYPVASSEDGAEKPTEIWERLGRHRP